MPRIRRVGRSGARSAGKLEVAFPATAGGGDAQRPEETCCQRCIGETGKVRLSFKVGRTQRLDLSQGRNLAPQRRLRMAADSCAEERRQGMVNHVGQVVPLFAPSSADSLRQHASDCHGFVRLESGYSHLIRTREKFGRKPAPCTGTSNRQVQRHPGLNGKNPTDFAGIWLKIARFLRSIRGPQLNLGDNLACGTGPFYRALARFLMPFGAFLPENYAKQPFSSDRSNQGPTQGLLGAAHFF